METQVVWYGWRLACQLPPCHIVHVAWTGNCLAELWNGPEWG